MLSKAAHRHFVVLRAACKPEQILIDPNELGGLWVCCHDRYRPKDSSSGAGAKVSFPS